jgi:putative ABC transport system ATP-binding protein
VLDLLTAMQRDRGLAMVMVTHSHEVAERADRIVQMKDGRVIGDSAREPEFTEGGVTTR